jgi:uncharacterized ferredoxin-like protein
VQAADSDLCATNIQSLKDMMNSAATTAPDVKDIVTTRIEEAQKAQSAGNMKECVDITTKALTKLKLYKK